MKFKLILAFLPDAHLDEVLKAARAAGATGSTVITSARGEPREVYFIASGAVELENAGQKSKLGRGEMFGQLALLSRQIRRTQITAISHTTLLVLDEARFRRLLQRSEAMRIAVKESAEKRGLSIESLNIDPPSTSG